MAPAGVELGDPRRNPTSVVVDDRHLGFRVDIVASRRHPVDRVIGPQRLPRVVVIGVSQAGLGVDEALDVG